MVPETAWREPAVRLGAAAAVLALVLDQIVKAFLLYGAGFAACCAYNRPFADACDICLPVEILPVFDLVMVWNVGVSFGLFPANSQIELVILLTFAIAVSGALALWLARVTDRLLGLAIGLTIGGALGNVIDRAVYGAVADFFDFHAFGYHWYVFNVADAAIVVGVGLLLFDALMLRRQAGGGAR
ncbi:MAG: signal peptidase II [Alphaproteobacteria bacterium]|nr:signal peptidase II [Alphaproteobacteria bacterium]